MKRNSYFDLRQLVSDKPFLLSVASSLIGVAGIMFSIITYVQSAKITAHLISNVTLLDSTTSLNIKPISELLDWVKDPKIIYSAYVANFKDVCNAEGATDASKDSVFLVQRAQAISATSMNIKPASCEIAKKYSRDENIFVTSDKPFANVPFEKKFIAVETPK